MAAERIIWDGFIIKESQINYEDEMEYSQINAAISNLVLTEFNLYQDPNGHVQGSGRQQINNDEVNSVNVVINGQYDSTTNSITFQKTANNTITYFTGNVAGDFIQGIWKETENGEKCGPFQLQRIPTKQGWNGYYMQFNHHYMNFENLNIDRVPQGKITGLGTDEVGDFEINGQFIYNENGVKFVKQYIGQHAIHYFGTLQGNVVKGHWGFEAGQPQDKFRLQFYE